MKPLCVLALFALLSPGLMPQAPLADLNSTPQPASSRPTFGASLPGGATVFAARTRSHGLEPWVLIGSVPTLLADLAPGTAGSAPRGFVRCGAFVYFAANDGVHGTELWRTDGTAAGTTMVTDLLPGTGGALPQDLVDVNGTLFFSAFTEATGRELYRSDGTAGGTTLVADVLPGPNGSNIGSALACGALLFFVADDFLHGDELWVSNGTAAGTVRLTDLRPSFDDGVLRSVQPVCCQGKAYFGSRTNNQGDELLVSDGTPGGTAVIDVRPGALSSFPSELTCCGSTVFFAATASSVGRELFKTDGTTAGTTLIKDINTGSSSSFPEAFACLNGQLLFAAQDPTLGKELFRSDGTDAGTVLVKDVFPGFLSGVPTGLVVAGGLAYFQANAPNVGRELFVSDGTEAGTTMVAETLPGSGNGDPRDLFPHGAGVAFSANGADGRELFVTDGTAGGTTGHDLDPTLSTASSRPRNFTPAGPNQFFFRATVPGFGDELCFFDGAQVIVHDLEPGPNGSFPAELTFVGDTLYFEARTLATGRELYRATRDTAPVLAADLSPGTGNSTPRDLTAFGEDGVIFSATIPGMGREVVIVSSSLPGPQVFDVRPGNSSSNPARFTVIEDVPTGVPVAFFAANDGIHGVELHATNGTATALVADLNPGPDGSDPIPVSGNQSLVAPEGPAGAELFFAGFGGAVTILEALDVIDPFGLLFDRNQVFQTASFAITTLVLATATAPHQFLGAATELSSTGIGSEVFTFDQVAGFVVHDLLPGILVSSFPDLFVREGNVTHFVATTEAEGREIHRYDADTHTFSTADLLPGPESSDPAALAPAGQSAVAVARSSDPSDLDVFEVEVGTATVVRDFGYDDDNAAFFDQILKRFYGDVIVAGSTDGEGREVHRVENAGGMADRFGKRTPGAALNMRDPELGGNLDIEVSFNGISVITTVLAVDVTTSFAALPLGGGELWLDPATLNLMATVSGASLSISAPIPNDPALAGLTFFLQAAGFTAGGGIAVTNAVGATAN